MSPRPAAILAASVALTFSALAVPPPGTPAASSNGGSGTEAAVNAIKAFKLDGDLKAELFAAEPLLKNGVSFSQDEKGRWYIAETYRQERGVEDNRAHANWLSDDIAARTTADRLAMIQKFYPEERKFAEKFTSFEDRIVRLDDTDGDGKPDTTVVFADGFLDPLDGTGAGILARGDDVWYTCIPNLWHFKNQGSGGQAELKEKLLSGFGVHFAFRGHDMHGLKFGPDGKLYFSIGDRGIHVETKEGKTVAEPDSGSIMRCNPDGTGFEVFATGVRNPQELAFNEFGDLFTGDNNSDSGDKARFTLLVEGGDCGWRMPFQYLSDRGPWNRERLWDPTDALKAKYIIPPVANIGNGPSGLVYNPGTGLSDKYKGRFFLSDFRGSANASVVHQIQVEPQGAFYKLKETRELVKGILTTDVDFGIDGAMYVLDWVESWGGVGKGRIYKLTDPKANAGQQAEVRKLISEGMTKRPEAELGTLLANADMRVRQAAQFELAARGEKALPVLEKVAKANGSQLARLHAIWGLGELAETLKEKALTPVAPLLGDGDAEVRAQAAHVLGDHKFALSAEKLVGLLKDSNNRVRYFAAQGLGKLAFAPAFEPLCAMLAENADKDPVLRHGGVMGLTGVATPAQLAAKSADKSVAVRVGALLALRRWQSGEIARFLNDPDQTVVTEAARAIYDTPIEEALPALAKLSESKAVRDPNTISRILNAHYRLGKAENATALALFAADPGAPDLPDVDKRAREAARRQALDALAQWGNPPARDRLLNLHRPLPPRGSEDAVAAITAFVPALLKEGSASVQEMVAQLAARLNLQSARDSLYTLAQDAKARREPRIAAIQALASLKDKRLPEIARGALKDKDATIRNQGLQSLAGVDPGGAITLIADLINSGTLLEKQGALGALSQIRRPEATALLGTLVDRLVAGGIAPEIQLDILDAARRAASPEVTARVKAYEASLPASDPLAAYRVSLAGGDANRGRTIFREKVEVQCIRCHKCEMGDSQVGPDLTHIGATKDRNYLLESIVFPNRKVAEGFETVVLTLKDKSMVVGRLAKSDATSLQIETLDEKGKPKSQVVPVAQIAERVSAPSPMPETTRDFLSKAELRDLIEYLATRK